MESQEQECFLERTRLAHRQLDSLNLTRRDLSTRDIEPYDALFIGGAGEYSAAGDYPWMPALLDVVRSAHACGLPTFGSCWGHQIIARALGGEVIHDATRAEMGCHPVILTDAGRSDELFGGFPGRFNANMGHHDRVTRLPAGAVELAFSATQPNQAFRLSGAPMFGTQFHSELDAHRERERLIRYREYYLEEMPDEAAYQAILATLSETTEVDHLMHDFLLKFVVNAE
jgi:GMP synthase (glutamine-hydrolysing)